MKLAIVGSSKLSEEQIEKVRKLVLGILRVDLMFCLATQQELIFVSGGAPGVDSIAEEIATLLEIPTKIFRPDVQKWKGYYSPSRGYLRGYRDRNLEIAEYCDKLVAIRSRFSTTYGSGWTADRAEDLGKEVEREDV